MPDDETPAPPANPVNPQPPATPAPPPPPPADWKGPEAVWYDLHKARTARTAAEHALEAERQRVAGLETTLTARATAAEQKAAELAAKYERDTTLLGTPGIPETFRHPRMRARLWTDYEAHRSAAGNKAVPFDAWVLSDEVKTDPLYAAHFAPAPPDPSQAPVLPVQTVAPPPPAVQHTGTVLPPTGQPVQYTSAMINRLRAEGQWKAGRVDEVTGKPMGGSAHWQAWINSGGKIAG